MTFRTTGVINRESCHFCGKLRTFFGEKDSSINQLDAFSLLLQVQSALFKMKRGAPRFPVVDWSEFHVWSPNGVYIRLKRDRPNAGLPNNSLPGRMNFSSDGVQCSTSLSAGASSRIMRQYKMFGHYCGREVKKVELIELHGHQRPGIIKEAYVQFGAGALGGSTATYMTHWLDTIKVKMQTKPGLYRSSFSCLRQTTSIEGVTALYQGAVPAVIGQTCKTAVVFMSYGLCEEAVRRLTGCANTHDMTIWHHAGSGAMTGIVASFVLCPLELIKCRLQALKQVTDDLKSSQQQKLLRSMTARRMVRHIIRKEGLPGLYRGLPGIWVKEVPGSFIYFGSYEFAKYGMRLATETEHLHHNTVFMCGMFAGLCFCITHPIESVKTRVQVMSVVANTSGFLRTFAHILKTEGLKPLMSGMGPSMVRACLYSGIQFMTYESVKEYFLDDY